MDNNNWGFAQVWNKSLIETEQRELKERDHLWASELGKSNIDIWLKLHATPLTNPPNARSLRKFEAGNVFEWIVSLILKRAGILKEAQRWSSYQYPNMLKVTGKADFIAGGKPDITTWEKEMESLNLPNVFLRAGERILKYFTENYPNGLEEMPLEIKSVSSFMFEALEKNKSSSKNHRLQVYHYLKAENRPKANIVYICRDDLRMMEFPVFINSYVEEEYKNVISEISKYYLSNERPPLEKMIVFSEDLGKFATNFNVGYSGYLTMLYGFKEQMEYDNKYRPIVSKWNRILNRIKKGDKMTAKNLEVLEEIKKEGFNLDDIKSKFNDVSEEETAE